MKFRKTKTETDKILIKTKNRKQKRNKIRRIQRDSIFHNLHFNSRLLENEIKKIESLKTNLNKKNSSVKL
jgi:hypothetical protein